MKEKKGFSPGEVVVLREIWAGRIWGAHPMIVVQDGPELLVLYWPAGTWRKRRRNLNGGNVSVRERKCGEWVLGDESRDDLSLLRLTIPGESYSVYAFRNCPDDSLRCWYINLEDPQKRTPIGFDHTDWILDVIIDPNLRDWRWDDEDELREAMALGLVSQEKAAALYAKGEEVRRLIMSDKSVFNPWEHWRPDPSWKTPVLPEGWDVI